MVSLSKFISIFAIISLFEFKFKPISSSQQSYDITSCISVPQVPGSNYLCNSEKLPCQAFIVYRAQDGFQSLSSTASLFNLTQSQLRPYNNFSEDYSSNLHSGQEVVIPIICSCLDRFSQSIFGYNAPSGSSDSLPDIACKVFEGLLKSQSLIEENRNFGGNGIDIKVPIRCACPDELDKSNGVNYLVTYPIIEKDQTDFMAQKFGVPIEMIWNANRLDPYGAIYPQTTLLIPMKNRPVVNWDVTSLIGHPPPSPKAVIPLKNIVGGTSPNSLSSYLFLGGGLFAATLLICAVCCLCISIRRRNHRLSFQPLSARTSQLSDFSPDFLDGMSKLKHSLMNFSLEELKIATEDFSEGSVVGTTVYRGRMVGGSKLAIEQMSSEDEAHRVMDMLTKINHLNVVKLEGCCYGTRHYLVFEYADNGSLRNCLSNAKMAKLELTWTRRLQIAFDLAVGLHYIHYCTQPAYAHRNINSRNVLITMDWRAKISGFRLAKPLICTEEKEETNWNESVVVGRKGYLATEYLTYGQASLKVDVFAFGVVLLELLSAKEAISEGNLLKDSVKFLADGVLECSSGCLEKLKAFMDPALDGDYPLGDAMCLALLAKGCVEDNPQHRPTMNDVLKALSRTL